MYFSISSYSYVKDAKHVLRIRTIVYLYNVDFDKTVSGSKVQLLTFILSADCAINNTNEAVPLSFL